MWRAYQPSPLPGALTPDHFSLHTVRLRELLNSVIDKAAARMGEKWGDIWHKRCGWGSTAPSHTAAQLGCHVDCFMPPGPRLPATRPLPAGTPAINASTCPGRGRGGAIFSVTQAGGSRGPQPPRLPLKYDLKVPAAFSTLPDSRRKTRPSLARSREMYGRLRRE